MATKGPKIICTRCHQDVRMYSLQENDGTFVGCECPEARFSMDMVPYDLRIGDLPKQWEVYEQPEMYSAYDPGPNEQLSNL